MHFDFYTLKLSEKISEEYNKNKSKQVYIWKKKSVSPEHSLSSTSNPNNIGSLRVKIPNIWLNSLLTTKWELTCFLNHSVDINF